MHANLDPHARQSAADRVYDHVKSGILEGRYAGGLLLTEGEIASTVEVSRTPVREAFLRLAVEGLIKLYPKKGALVVPVTGQEAEGIIEARTLIETWAVPHAFANRVELTAELEPLLDEMTQRREAGDHAEFAVADRAFHERIVAAAGNDVLTRFYRSLRERQVCINAATTRVDTGRMDIAVHDHTQLLEALRSGDETQFAARTAEHLERAASHARGLR